MCGSTVLKLILYQNIYLSEKFFKSNHYFHQHFSGILYAMMIGYHPWYPPSILLVSLSEYFLVDMPLTSKNMCIITTTTRILYPSSE